MEVIDRVKTYLKEERNFLGVYNAQLRALTMVDSPDEDEIMETVSELNSLIKLDILTKEKVKRTMKKLERYMKQDNLPKINVIAAGKIYAELAASYARLSNNKTKDRQRISSQAFEVLKVTIPPAIGAGAYIYLTKLGYKYEIQGIENPETGEVEVIKASKPLARVLGKLGIK